MTKSQKRDLLITALAVGVVATWALASSGAPNGFTAVAVSSGVQELPSSPRRGYVFTLPAGGAYVTANLSGSTGLRVLFPKGRTLTAADVASGSLLTIVWTLGGVTWTSVYTVQ